MDVKRRNILMIFIGAAVLLLKGRYSGPAQELIRGYAGNISVSFAVYFNVGLADLGSRHRSWKTALLALAAVELFEATNGFGFISNTYDPWDYVANLVGVAIALGVDAILRSKRKV
jgi:hypothetical protein